jgi:hypothetical protein
MLVGNRGYFFQINVVKPILQPCPFVQHCHVGPKKAKKIGIHIPFFAKGDFGRNTKPTGCLKFPTHNPGNKLIMDKQPLAELGLTPNQKTMCW